VPSHSVNPSPLQPAPAVAAEAGQGDAEAGRGDAVPATSPETASPDEQPAAGTAGADAAVGMDEKGGEDLPMQPPEDYDSDATQPGDPPEDPQPDEVDAAEHAELQPPDVAHIAEVMPAPGAPKATDPAADADDVADDGGEKLTPESPFAAAKTAADGRHRGSAALQRAKPPRAADPYAFPETQDIVAPRQLPWTRKRGAKAGQPAALAPVITVPESTSAPTTSHEQTTSAADADAGAAASPDQEGPGEAAAPVLAHAESPDQQSQHVPKASAARGVAAAHGVAEVSSVDIKPDVPIGLLRLHSQYLRKPLSITSNTGL